MKKKQQIQKIVLDYCIDLKTFSSDNTIYLMIKIDNGELDENIYVTYINNLHNSPTGFEMKSPSTTDKEESTVAYYLIYYY